MRSKIGDKARVAVHSKCGWVGEQCATMHCNLINTRYEQYDHLMVLCQRQGILITSGYSTSAKLRISQSHDIVTFHFLYGPRPFRGLRNHLKKFIRCNKFQYNV